MLPCQKIKTNLFTFRARKVLNRPRVKSYLPYWDSNPHFMDVSCFPFLLDDEFFLIDFIMRVDWKLLTFVLSTFFNINFKLNFILIFDWTLTFLSSQPIQADHQSDAEKKHFWNYLDLKTKKKVNYLEKIISKKGTKYKFNNMLMQTCEMRIISK